MCVEEQNVMQNPLESYRRTQRELRQAFETFTRENCPTCPTPCCRQPARILPTDILLAEATGWKAQLPNAEQRDLVAEVAGDYAAAMANPPESAEVEENEEAPLCQFLGARGCTFPNDLRPFGCTTYICRYMHAKLDKKSLARLKRLVRELEQKHTILLRTIRPVAWDREDS
jgi:Fe-S-cluster containining protein